MMVRRALSSTAGDEMLLKMTLIWRQEWLVL
jgi:hypothetical protein